jgi:DNA-binding transcriptional ArsR family regulator
MLDLLYIQEIEQASALMQPLRVTLLKLMAEPRTCTELGEHVGQSPQRVYYHVKKLEQTGLVEKTSEQRVRGIMEGYYQAKARSYWLSPQLVGQLGGRKRAREQASLAYLLALAEELQNDIGLLGQQTGQEIPSLGLSARIELRDENERVAFMSDVQAMFQELARKYGEQQEVSTEEESGPLYKLALACYPQVITNQTDTHQLK